MTYTIIIISILILVVFLFKSKKGTKQENPNPTISKSARNKSNKTWGKFNVVGYHHLSDEIKKKVWKELKVGSELILLPDPKNEFDNKAIKVIFNDVQIGWFPKDHDRKLEIFKIISEKRSITTVCTKNVRGQDYVRATRPESDGTWKDEYRGMAQFVEAKFTYELI